MARFLIVVPPFAGHVNPTISVGRALEHRGHSVAWCGLPGAVDRLLPADLTFLPATPERDDTEVALAAVSARATGLRGAAALRFLWADALLPLAHEMVAGVEHAVDRFEPDVLVADQQALAGAVVARRRHLPWVTSATTSAELTDPLAGLPLVDAWVREQLIDVQVTHGVDPILAHRGDLRFSDQLVLAFTTEAFVGASTRFGHQYAFVGPSFGERGDTTSFAWSWLDPDRPHVLVSLGTLNAEAGDRFFAVAIDALADTRWQAIIVASPDRLAPMLDAAEHAGRDVTNVMVAERVPQVELLAHLDAVVCHAGHNTVCESLAHAVPLVVAPIRDDQPIVADQVERAGAGVRVKFGRVRAEQLRAAIGHVADDPAIATAVRSIQHSFTAAGGAPLAARRLEELACTPAPSPAR